MLRTHAGVGRATILAEIVSGPNDWKSVPYCS